MHNRIFLVDVLGNSSKITMKLNFNHLEQKFTMDSYKILGLVKKLVKVQLIYANIKKFKTTFLQLA
jgi:hypothetical protein